jgi:superfamily II DNA or RNA helicase
MSKDTSASAEQVNLLPYQAEFIERTINARIPARLLLSSPPGAGKSFAMASLAGAMQKRNQLSRCLVIIPAPFLLMWQEDLRRYAGIESLVMTAQTYRMLQADTNRGFNVWLSRSSVVVSIDFLKAGARVEEALAAGWDLIIFDEVQLCSGTSQRGDVAKRIWTDSVIPLVVAATAVPDGPEWILQESCTQRIEWNNADLARYFKLPKRTVQIIEYDPTGTEREVSTKIYELIGNLQKTPESDFIGTILRRRLNSSVYALEQSVRNLQGREPYLEQVAEDQPDDLEEMMSSLITTEIGIDVEASKQIIALLEGGAKDNKWDRCEQLLKDYGIGQTCSGVIFTDFADTAQFLGYMGTSRGFKTFSITGSSSLEQRQQALDDARSGPSILIVTTAVEGLSFGFTNQVIHYDLPWDPMALLQRYGRVERLGSQFSEIYHYLLVAHESATEAVLQALLKKLESLEEAWR